MNTEQHITEALKDLRERAGFSIREVSAILGLSSTSYQRYERPHIFNGTTLPKRHALNLADAYCGRGTPPITKDEVMRISGYGDFQNNITIQDALQAPLIGEAKAGTYVDFLSSQPLKNIPITSDDRYPDSTPRFCLLVKGKDAGENFPDGSYAVCVGSEHLTGEIENNKFVVVHQRKSGLTEVTIKKKAVRNDGSLWLLSGDPNIEPIPYDSKDVEIRGLVISVEITL